MPVPLVLIAAGIAAGATAGANAYANSKDSQIPRIKELKGARARGLLTTSGQQDVEQGYDQARRMQTAAQENTARQLAAMGGTSGADIKALREADDKGIGTLYSELGDRVQQTRKGEELELAQHQHLKRQRLLGTVKGSVQSGAAVGSAVAQAEAYKTGKGKPAEMPDFSGLDADTAAAGSAYWKAGIKAGKSPQELQDGWSALLEASDPG